MCPKGNAADLQDRGAVVQIEIESTEGMGRHIQSGDNNIDRNVVPDRSSVGVAHDLDGDGVAVDRKPRQEANKYN